MIEEIRVGDVVLSRNEDNPSAPVVERVVEEVFIRVGPVVRLVVGGKELRPTGEHPFYVPGRGWRLAGELRKGDVVLSLTGEPIPVDEVVDAGEVVTVYNFRVTVDHTYFVGGDDWGFAVWVHNTNKNRSGETPPSGKNGGDGEPGGQLPEPTPPSGEAAKGGKPTLTPEELAKEAADAAQRLQSAKKQREVAEKMYNRIDQSNLSDAEKAARRIQFAKNVDYWQSRIDKLAAEVNRLLDLLHPPPPGN
jgi:intein/homing endonuclease